MDMDTNETTTNGPQDWAAAAAASEQAETARKQSSRPPRRFVEALPCKLTADELLVIGKEVVKAEADVHRLEDERKEHNDRFKTQIATAEQRRSDLIAKLDSETEIRDVELIEHFVFETNTVIVRRTDTDEIYSERAMRLHERQADLPFETEPSESSDDVEAAAVDRTAETEPPPPSDDDTSIDDPQAVLNGDAEPAPEGTPKRVRRGRKSAS